MINTQHLTWVDLTSANDVPRAVLCWLDDAHSLTAKLKQKFDDFTVDVRSQTQTTPHQNESEVLNFAGQSVVREVALLGGGQAVVFARSVIPITDDTKELLSIGAKPLGEVLFNNADIKRGKIQITRADNTWGRRSIFTVGTTQLLVSEFFLNHLYEPENA